MRKQLVFGLSAVVLSAGLASCGSSGDKPDVKPPAPKISNDAAVPEPAYDNNNPGLEGNNPQKVEPQPEVQANLTSMLFEEYKHDFGNVPKEGPNEHVFKFTNTGDNPLTIKNASASCGCTVPNWPKEPIMPGDGGEIKVVFTPKENQAGKPVTKTVTVMANVEGGSQQLNITAQVAAE